MLRLRGFRRVIAPIRDFTCAFAAFLIVAYVLLSEQTYMFPPTVISLIASEQGAPALRAWGEFGAELTSAAYVPQSIPGALVLALFAVVFSAIVAVNLAVLRHLRRVHASSRRGAWREG